jgi:MFS transporter, SHS family, lactate transporter
MENTDEHRMRHNGVDRVATTNSMHPPHHGMSPGRYLATRFSSLKPPMRKAPNPIRLVMMLNRHQWAFFGIAFFAWVRKFNQLAWL